MCELVPSVVNALKAIYEFRNIYFWTYSSIVYSWVEKNIKPINLMLKED